MRMHGMTLYFARAFFLFRTLFSVITARNFAKLYNTFESEPDLKMIVKIWGSLP